MGLDNGIILETKEPPLKGGFRELKYEIKDAPVNEFEIIYWRKQWDLRNKIVYEIFDGESENGMHTLNSRKISEIIEEIKGFIANNEKEPEFYVDGWLQDIANLISLQGYMTNYPDNIIRCYFYDSY